MINNPLCSANKMIMCDKDAHILLLWECRNHINADINQQNNIKVSTDSYYGSCEGNNIYQKQ